MEPTRADVDLVVDTLGLLCPMPIVKAQNAARSLEPGQRMELVSDDRGILADMPAWCTGMGHQLEAIDEDGDGRWHCFVVLKS